MKAPHPQVVATAGHVDHGKSALILRLTGMDPDRWAEEKRRGLTIDLGFAWCTLPSGREIGFVDVPGHERFIRNMLAGVGPVRLVLFVVAADEGWKPQSEEHLAIVDVLGAHAGVVALTKLDLVDEETIGLAMEETRDRLAGTALEKAEIVPCSSITGAGLDELRFALDRMIEAAPEPERDGRPRQFVDRVFSIRGAGTVVTGTLTGGPLDVGREVELYPTGARARVRGLQSHKRAIEVATPVARVAANLVGIERAHLERGDVLGLPGQWRPTSVIEAHIFPVRGLDHPLTGRGAYKLHAGAAERDARIRFYSGDEPRPTGESRTAGEPRPAGWFARIRLSAPLVLDVHDRFVLREAGRRETVAGGVVLDVDPPLRPGPSPDERLSARRRASREELPALLVSERGAVRAGDVAVLTGAAPSDIDGAARTGSWWVSEELLHTVSAAVLDTLGAYHREHPLREAADVSLARTSITAALERGGRAADPGLTVALLDHVSEGGAIVRTASEVRLASHRAAIGERREDLERLLHQVERAEPNPPSVSELVAEGFGRELIEAAVRTGELVKIAPDIVFTSAFVGRAEGLLRSEAREGITVSRFRELLGTSRKYAVPLLEHFDHRRVTLRQGDLRVLREG